MALKATYFDGRTSRAHPVRLSRNGDRLNVSGDGIAFDVALDEVKPSSRIGDSPRYLNLPGGARCEVDDHDALQAIFPGDEVVHRLERRWSWVIAATLFTAVFVWASIEYALPALARTAAHAVPVSMEHSMGEQSLAALDSSMMKASRLMEVDRERTRAAFARVTSTLEGQHGARLELWRSETLGANAFALPSGIVVITDEMVELAKTDEELMAVIAHELGHVHHRHIMRSVLQNSVVALLLASLLGDVTSITGLAASIPTFLVEQRYSREFEFEADAFALQWMRNENIAPQNLARILQRLADTHGMDANGVEKYLSTHPSMDERIDVINNAR